MAVLKLEYRQPHPDEELHELTQRIEAAEEKLRLRGWREMVPDVAAAAEKVYATGINDNLTWFTKRGYVTVQQAQRVAKDLAKLTRLCQVLDLEGTKFLVLDGGEDE